MIDLILDDCMNVMKDYEDNHFDLAIVDPPYMDNANKLNSMNVGGKIKRNNFTTRNFKKPNKTYFKELFRVSKNQIKWGINYFENFGAGRIVWDKDKSKVRWNDCEIAYQSFSNSNKIFRYRWNGMLQEDMKNKEERIHPTQKPIALYKWLLHNYAEKGQKILDTHLGSGSIAVACHYFGVDLVGVEIDEEYYDKAKDRVNELTKQETLF